MRLFTDKDQATLNRLQHERDSAFEAATRFADANLRLADENMRLAGTNNLLSLEVIRLSQRANPVVPEGEIEQPKSVTDNDVVLESPERAIRPEPPRPARVE